MGDPFTAVSPNLSSAVSRPARAHCEVGPITASLGAPCGSQLDQQGVRLALGMPELLRSGNEPVPGENLAMYVV